MYVFTAKNFEGKLKECDEGELEWIDKQKIYDLNIWEGDKIFLEKIKDDCSFFTAEFEYNDDKLIRFLINEY